MLTTVDEGCANFAARRIFLFFGAAFFLAGAFFFAAILLFGATFLGAPFFFIFIATFLFAAAFVLRLGAALRPAALRFFFAFAISSSPLKLRSSLADTRMRNSRSLLKRRPLVPAPERNRLILS